MGATYSVGPFPKDVKSFINLELNDIRGKIYRYEKTVNRRFDDYFFMSRKQFQWTFLTSDELTYSLFQRYDPDGYNRIPCIDIWGAMVLAANAKPEEKINFLFNYMNVDRDNYLSKLDCQLLIRCATRGFSRLKRIKTPSDKLIKKIVSEIFAREGVVLSEQGGMHLRDFRAFLLVDDRTRNYLSNLGTLIAVQDNNKLIDQRSDLLKELALVEAELQEVVRNRDITEDDLRAFAAERGGDVQYLKLTEQLLNNQVIEADAVPSLPQKKDTIDQSDALNTMIEHQRKRRQERLRAQGKYPDPPENVLADADAFARGCKPSNPAGTSSNASVEQAILYKWEGLKPQAEDKMVTLDVDTIEDLLDVAGIHISDEDAGLCLESLPQNSQGRHNSADFFAWLRNYRFNPPKTNIPPWRNLAWKLRETGLHYIDSIQKCISIMLRQNRVVQEIKRVKTMRKREVRKQILMKKTSLLGSSGFDEQETAGSIRLSTWHRHKLLEEPCKIGFMASFGPECSVPEKKSTDKKASPSKRRRSVAETEEEEFNKFKTRLALNITVRPESKRRDDLIGKDGLLHQLENTEVGDFLHFFASNIHDSAINDHVKVHRWGTITYILIDIAATATHEEGFTLLKTACNLFESIPLDYRGELYTHVKGQLFYLPLPKEDKEKDKKTTEKKDTPDVEPEPINPRLACVALLHERDAFQWLEDQLTDLQEIQITRALRSFNLEIRLQQTLQELLAFSKKFDFYAQRLYGPQEDELGEEGMNPLRFAKVCRQRKKAAEEAIETAQSMTVEQLRQHLTVRGLNDRGGKADLVDRVQRAFRRQLELIGVGEISSFGAEMVKRIFARYDVDKDGGLSLNEYNNLLFDVGAETIYDMQEYRRIMASEELLLDKNNYLTCEGLIAYYEKYGRLAKDMEILGIGSISEMIQGEIECRLQYEADAIASLYTLLEKHTLASRLIKMALGVTTSLSEVFFSAEYKRLYELFVSLEHSKSKINVSKLLYGSRTPGWLSSAIAKVSSWLADGSEGMLKTLRSNASNICADYADFEKAFIELFKEPDSESETTSTAGDDASSQSSSADKVSAFTAPSVASKSSRPPRLSSVLEDDDGRNRRMSVESMLIDFDDRDDSSIGEMTEAVASQHDFPIPDNVAEWKRKLNVILPPILSTEGGKSYNTIISENLNVAHNCHKRLASHERLTRREREMLKQTCETCEQNARDAIERLEKSIQLTTAHFVAFYDAFRMYGTGFRTLCYGTKELSVSVNLAGVSVTDLLPAGKGELSVIQQALHDKMTRAVARKTAALKAIERERMRRDLDAAERERRRKWELENMQLLRDEEEKAKFVEAYAALMAAREENVRWQDIGNVIDLWRALLQLRESRYPKSLKLAGCQTNLACLLIEYFPHIPVRVNEAVTLFRSCAIIVYRIATQQLEEYEKEQSVSRTLDEDSETASPIRKIFAPNSPASLAVCLINYITVLRITKNESEMAEELCTKIKLLFHSLYEHCTDKEKANMHVERNFELLSVFPFGDIKESIALTFAELEIYWAEEKKRLAAEALQKRLDEFRMNDSGVKRREGLNMSVEEQNMGMDVLGIVDPKRAQKLKFERLQRENKKKRDYSVRQRKKMYDMIASDEISSFFHIQAQRVALDKGLGVWGTEIAEVDDPFAVAPVSSRNSEIDEAEERREKNKVKHQLSLQQSLPQDMSTHHLETTFETATPKNESPSSTSINPQLSKKGSALFRALSSMFSRSMRDDGESRQHRTFTNHWQLIGEI